MIRNFFFSDGIKLPVFLLSNLVFMLSNVLAAFRSTPESVGTPRRPPRYDGEDTTPTSHREILGWYSYGIAAEVFAVCGVGL